MRTGVRFRLILAISILERFGPSRRFESRDYPGMSGDGQGLSIRGRRQLSSGWVYFHP